MSVDKNKWIEVIAHRCSSKDNTVQEVHCCEVEGDAIQHFAGLVLNMKHFVWFFGGFSHTNLFLVSLLIKLLYIKLLMCELADW